MPESTTNPIKSNITDHTANERTFLAWIRTSIAIMAFGFVVEKFSLFLRQLAVILEAAHPGQVAYNNNALHGYSSISGILIVAFGAFMGFFAFLQYRKVMKQIEQNTYEHSIGMAVILTAAVCLMGLLLVIYLMKSL